MDVVYHAADIGELGIRQDGSLFIAVGFVASLLHPAVINVDVLVSVVGHAGGDHHVGRVAHVLLGDVMIVDVPTVPAHRRGQSQCITDDDSERPLVRPVLIPRSQRHRPFASLTRDPACDDTGLRVELQVRRQPRRGKPNRSGASARDSVDERSSRAGAIDPWPVDLWLRPRLGRQDHSGLGGRLWRIDGLGPAAGHDEFRPCPVRVVEVDPVAGRGYE